jgi:hypothetical protein
MNGGIAGRKEMKNVGFSRDSQFCANFSPLIDEFGFST